MHHIYIKIIKNMGYAPGLALGRCSVSGVSHGRLLELLRHEDLLVLFDDLLILLIVDGPKLHQVVLYTYAVMMQQLVFRQHQLLKCNAHTLSYKASSKD
jgi:hypothetical protein